MPRTVLLPWERPLWKGRSVLTPWTRYYITDFRAVSRDVGRTSEIAFHDIRDVRRSTGWLDYLLGTSTVTIEPVRRGSPMALAHIRRGEQAAALLALVAADPAFQADAESLQAALSWTPRRGRGGLVELLAAAALIMVAMVGVVSGRRHAPLPVRYAADDAIAPDGVKRSERDIVRFMEAEVMPWARETLGVLKGGADRITCATCHGRDADARGWAMPAVAAVPSPDLKSLGWERYSGGMDAQMRNAIYGYLADSDKQKRAAYMREVVMPGMARLLHRPPYDFTKPYEYNRHANAFGCYHCHRLR